MTLLENPPGLEWLLMKVWERAAALADYTPIWEKVVHALLLRGGHTALLAAPALETFKANSHWEKASTGFLPRPKAHGSA